MQLIIDVKDSAIDKIMYFLEHLQDDVKIVSKTPDSDLDIEIIAEDDPDFQHIKEARERRAKGEKTYTLDEVMQEYK